MVPSSNPHDGVFRAIMGTSVNAASQLSAVLPSALTARLDLGRLEQVSGSLVDETLQWRHSDLVFTVPFDGQDAFLYVLIEHQSSSDRLMPYRMLRYTVRLWDTYLADHPHTHRLPMVIPIVVHHNRRPWTAPTDLHDLFDVEPLFYSDDGAVATKAHVGMESLVPRFRYLLDDLAAVDEAELRTRPLTPTLRLALVLLKIAAGNPRLDDDLRDWIDDLLAIGVDDMITLLTYIERVGETPPDALAELVAELGPEAEEAYMTTADMLRAEGEVRGRAEGEVRGRAETLIEQLTMKFGALPESAAEAILSASTEELRTWTTRVLTADTLDDVLR